MPAFLLPLLGSAWRVAIGLLSSPAGWVVMAFVAGWLLGADRVRDQWQAENDKEKRDYAEEVARQENAGHELAAEATKRLAEEIEQSAAMAEIIAKLENEERVTVNVPTSCPATGGPVPRPCVIDGDFAGRMRALDRAASYRTRAPSRRAR